LNYNIDCRSLAKETDGDFAKFVLTTRKPRDMAQKWRAYKNFARFFKNPFGYLYWKIHPLHAANRIRFIWVLLVFHLYSSFLLWVMIKNSKLLLKVLTVLYREGENDRALEIQTW
jgi:hypothetical protein